MMLIAYMLIVFAESPFQTGPWPQDACMKFRIELMKQTHAPVVCAPVLLGHVAIPVPGKAQPGA